MPSPDNHVMMPIIMKKKLALVPAVVLSSALLLTACSSGSPATNNNASASANPSASSSAPTNPTNSPIPSTTAMPTAIAGYVAPPQALQANYKQFFKSFTTTDSRVWDSAQAGGATKAKDDPATRSMTVNEYESMRTDPKQRPNLIKTNWNIQSDLETTAQNISDALAKNANESLDDLKADKSLIVNRYSNVGSMSIEQDNGTKFFFVIFRVNDQNYKGFPMGVLVPQAGKTPDFQHTAGPDTTTSK